MSENASIPLPLQAKTVADVRRQVATWRALGETVALVPTMGALHAGHLALVQEAKKRADRVVVSIFVNPAQFGPTEDFSRYPRQMEADLSMLHDAAVDMAWLPEVKDIYPGGFSTTVSVGPQDAILCGAHRPGHFNGVATVVTILLNAVMPDVAIFGQKDFQQLWIIKRLATDLRLPGEIVGLPTVREADGLALSSRNRYLSKDERALAPMLHETLQEIREDASKGRPLAELIAQARVRLHQAGFAVDYLEARDEAGLALMDAYAPQGRLFVAAKLGATRLIDNLPLKDTA